MRTLATLAFVGALTSCWASSSVSHSSPSAPSGDDLVSQEGEGKKDVITLYILDAKGKGWSASKRARAAMKDVKGIDRMFVSGTRITFTLKPGTKVDRKAFEAELEEAVEDQELEFVALESREAQRAKAAWVANAPVTWAETAAKVRATLLETLPHLQDAFVGDELVLHLAKDEPLDEAKLAAALKKHEVKMKGKAKKDAGYVL